MPQSIRRAVAPLLFGLLLLGGALPANAQHTEEVMEPVPTLGEECVEIVRTLNAGSDSGNGVVLRPCR